MTICFEIEGGCRNGKLQGIEASMQYLLTNAGELGRTFWLAPSAALDHWFARDAPDESEVAQKYRIVARSQQGERITIKARHIPADEPTTHLPSEEGSVGSSAVLCHAGDVSVKS